MVSEITWGWYWSKGDFFVPYTRISRAGTTLVTLS